MSSEDLVIHFDICAVMGDDGNCSSSLRNVSAGAFSLGPEDERLGNSWPMQLVTGIWQWPTCKQGAMRLT